MDLETAGYAPAETDDAETEVAEDDPCFAILTNPLTIILTPLIYDGYWEIPLYVEWALSYLGVDIEGRVVVVDGEVGAIGLAGFRIQPFGSGLEHVYIVPRVGGGSYVGFAASLNWGYEYFFEHFVLGVGGSIVYATGYEEIPVMGYFNILLGVGG